MIGIVQHSFLHLGRSAPQDKHNGTILCIQCPDGGICKLFPTFPVMGIGHVCPHGKHRIEHQDTLLGPFYKITIVRDIASQIIVKFLINIHQRRGNIYIRLETDRTRYLLGAAEVSEIDQNGNECSINLFTLERTIDYVNENLTVVSIGGELVSALRLI